MNRGFLETGIPKLDDILGGGIPMGKSLLYYIQPGVEGDVFGMQTMHYGLKSGMKIVYITTTSPPENVREDMLGLGFNFGVYNDGFSIVDAYSMLIGMNSEERYVVDDPESIESYDRVMEKVIEENDVIIFGSLSDIFDLCGEEEALEHIKRWTKDAFLRDVAIIANFTAWPYLPVVTEGVKDTFNVVVIIAGVAERVILGQYYSVIKMNSTKVEKKMLLFKIFRPGGVKAYIPKILVTGPYNAGKSTFVRSLSTRSVSVDRLGTTVALDHGYVEHEGVSAHIFGTPGQVRFDPILEKLGGEAVGVFLVVDSTDPKSFPRAKKMLELTRSRGLPCVLIANKQDLKDALSEEKVKEKIAFLNNIHIAPTVASTGKGVLNALEILIDDIMKL
jgi:hypothetical protein